MPDKDKKLFSAGLASLICNFFIRFCVFSSLIFSHLYNNELIIHDNDDNDNNNKQFVHLNPIQVQGAKQSINKPNDKKNYQYITFIASMIPSPDWFTGFYQFNVVDAAEETYYNHFIIHQNTKVS